MNKIILSLFLSAVVMYFASSWKTHYSLKKVGLKISVWEFFTVPLATTIKVTYYANSHKGKALIDSILLFDLYLIKYRNYKLGKITDKKEIYHL